MYRQVQLVKKGKMTKKEVDEGFESWKAHVKRGNSWKVIQRTEKYYKNLWIGWWKNESGKIKNVN